MRVFISHSPKDQKKVKDLASGLSAAGHEVWLPEVELFPGDNWGLKVGEALAHSNAMVILISPEWAKSAWERNEALFALGSMNYAGRVVPALLRPTREIPWILTRIKMIHAGKSWSATKRKILRQLGETARVSG